MFQKQCRFLLLTFYVLSDIGKSFENIETVNILLKNCIRSKVTAMEKI